MSRDEQVRNLAGMLSTALSLLDLMLTRDVNKDQEWVIQCNINEGRKYVEFVSATL